MWVLCGYRIQQLNDFVVIQKPNWFLRLTGRQTAAAICLEWFHFHVLAKTKMKVIKGDSTRSQVLWQYLHFHLF